MRTDERTVIARDVELQHAPDHKAERPNRSTRFRCVVVRYSSDAGSMPMPPAALLV